MSRRSRGRNKETFTQDQAESNYIRDVGSHPDYLEHINKTAIKLGLDKKVVAEVLDHYFLAIYKRVHILRKEKVLRINLYAFGFIDVLLFKKPIKNNKSNLK